MLSSDLFPTPLGPDPAVALPSPSKAVLMRNGPLPKVQYVIEFVGPRSVAASLACHLLDVNWYEALGKPEAWCMRSTDTSWQPLTASTDGSYDSLAIAWNMVSPPLNLSLSRGLLARAEEFAQHIQRRAMPMPIPEEVAKVVTTLQSVRDGLDIGFALAYGPARGFVTERDLWVQCSRLGLTFGTSGAFEWKVEGNDSPLLSVTPIGVTDAFSLAAVQRGESHEGATIGFSFPRCPSPAEALEGCFHIGKVLKDSLGGTIFDEDGYPLTVGTERRLRTELQQGERLFARAGIQPGSNEACYLWR